MALHIQELVRKQYAFGDFAHITVAALDHCGAGLLRFLVDEAGDAASLVEYDSMLQFAIQQLRTLRNDLGLHVSR